MWKKLFLGEKQEVKKVIYVLFKVTIYNMFQTVKQPIESQSMIDSKVIKFTSIS